MPKIIDHDQRRHDIAVAACRAINRYGLDDVTLAQIAREAGNTTGMLAHYYESRWDVILAALRLMHDRLEARLAKRMASKRADLTTLLADTLPIDEERRAEAAAWLTFWGAALKHPEMLKMTEKTYADWRGIVERTVEQCHPGAHSWPSYIKKEVVSSLVLFMDGLSVKALTRAEQYPARTLLRLLKGHLNRLLSWADNQVGR
jgi:TetR/AcrR family transcriptional regulator, transcriptional repressor of bet genes